MSEKTRAFARGTLAWTAILSISLPATLWALRSMERQLTAAENNGIVADKAQVTVERIHYGIVGGRPDWIPLTTARQIVSSFIVPDAAYEDPDLTERVRKRAASNPWVSEVHGVTKQLTADPRIGTVRVHCAFRRPVAKLTFRNDAATTDETTLYVDTCGVRLPSSQVPKYEAWMVLAPGAKPRWMPLATRQDVPADAPVRFIYYPLIRGVVAEPPRVGEQWRGGDIAAGLRLIKLITDRQYADQIAIMDVRNYDGRISPHEPHLRMWAQVDQEGMTDIRFGRFPVDVNDYVVSPQRKLTYLDEYVRLNGGRLAGLHRYLDLRYDQGYASLH